MTVGTRWHIVVIIPTSWSAADPIVWVIPVVVLGLSTWAAVIRLTRASVLEIISMDYIRTARAKGLANGWSSGATRCATRSSPCSPSAARPWWN